MTFDIATRWRALNSLLVECENLWRPRPFRESRPAWIDRFPDLSAWLAALSDADVIGLEDDHAALCTVLATHIPGIAQLPKLGRAPRTTQLPHSLPVGFAWEIAGRKWAQVCALADFIAAREHAAHRQTSSSNATTPMIDWCSGKGHLARSIAIRTGGTVIGLERNEVLCTDGNRLAQRDNLNVRVHKVDVLTEAAEVHIHAGGHIVALHACGKLHVRLLRLAVLHGTQHIDLVPCCHHLCSTNDIALSQLARTSPLSLAPNELQLAVQETVTSGASRRRDRERESSWRLGFDLLQRQCGGTDTYLPVPSIPRALLRTSFANFVCWAIQRKQLSMQLPASLNEFEVSGHRRHREVTRLALLRHAFRRPLEMYIVCDRAHYLEENGFAAEILELCAREVTPRNLLIAARRC